MNESLHSCYGQAYYRQVTKFSFWSLFYCIVPSFDALVPNIHRHPGLFVTEPIANYILTNFLNEIFYLKTTVKLLYIKRVSKSVIKNFFSTRIYGGGAGFYQSAINIKYIRYNLYEQGLIHTFLFQYIDEWK